MAGEKARTPEIRFAGFADPWEQRKLGELGFAQSGVGFPDVEQGGTEGVPFFKVSDMNTPGNENELVRSNNYVTDEQITRRGWKPIETVPAIFFAKVGAAVMLNRKRLVKEPFLLDNNTMAYMFDADSWDPQFSKTLFETIDLTTLVQVGALPSYNASDVEDLEVTVPSTLPEQEEIGRYFAKLDNLITLHQRKLDKLKVFKKSMLGKMFPKDGATAPEIRFAGFADPWEQRKLGDLLGPMEYGLNAASSEYDGENKYLRITDIDDETHVFKDDDLTSPAIDLKENEHYLISEDDLLFARTGASVGKTYLYRENDGRAYFAGFLIRGKVLPTADSDFVFQSTLTEDYQKYIAITSQRSGQPGVNAQEYSEYSLLIPELKEQKAIGGYLRSLDNLITLHQRKLDLLKNVKKSMLDKMFV